MCATNFPAGYQMSLETSCPNTDIRRLVALGIGIGEERMTRNTRATSDWHIDLEVYSKCVCLCDVFYSPFSLCCFVAQQLVAGTIRNDSSSCFQKQVQAICCGSTMQLCVLREAVRRALRRVS